MKRKRRWAIPIALVVAVLAAAGCGSKKESMSAGADWTTNGGATSNQRYSTLDEIDTSNVSQLKGVWRTHLNGVAMAAKYSGESQPVVQDGVIYVSAGNDDVFAVSVDSGKILWQYKANLDQKISTVCCGWLNRGVALGDGRVYLGQLDGKVRALDQKTGAVVWTRQLVQWQKGQTITGGAALPRREDLHRRRRRRLRDARLPRGDGRDDRRQRVALLHDPRAGRAGQRDLARTARRIEQGGASVWSTPAFDQDLNLLYITTGNAGNDWYGGDRPGDNLYAASIVAIDRDTGQAQVALPGSAPRHLGLRLTQRARPLRRRRHQGHRCAREDRLALPARPRDGQAALRDRREAGAAERGAEDRGDAADPAQRRVHPAHPADRQGDRAGQERDHRRREEHVPVVVAKEMYTPPSTSHMLIYTPGPQGGDNWEPSSYSQKTNMFYVCSAVQTVGVQSAELGFVEGKASPGIGAIAGIGYNESSGTLTAIDATDGSVAWQKTLARLLLQRHRLDGRQRRLRRPQLRRAAGVRRHERRHALELPDRCRRERHGDGVRAGRQAVRRLPLGGQLARRDARTATTSGCSRSTARSARPPAPGTGTGTEHAGEGGTTTGDAAAGKTVFSDNCAGCHGALGTGGNGGPDLTAIPSAKDKAAVVKQVTNGGGGMPAFKGQLTEQQIQDVSAYVTSEITNK